MSYPAYAAAPAPPRTVQSGAPSYAGGTYSAQAPAYASGAPTVVGAQTNASIQRQLDADVAKVSATTTVVARPKPPPPKKKNKWAPNFNIQFGFGDRSVNSGTTVVATSAPYAGGGGTRSTTGGGDWAGTRNFLYNDGGGTEVVAQTSVQPSYAQPPAPGYRGVPLSTGSYATQAPSYAAPPAYAQAPPDLESKTEAPNSSRPVATGSYADQAPSYAASAASA